MVSVEAAGRGLVAIVKLRVAAQKSRNSLSGSTKIKK